METLEITDAKYVQGFNEGYLITQHLPSFKEIKGLENTSRGLGFQDGQKQVNLEKNIDRLPWMRTENKSDQARDKTMGRDDLDKA